jgi:putative tRNA adenosine deaminase-associated protein
MARFTRDNDLVTDFAAVFALGDEGWAGAEADLAEVMAIEDIADLMREAAVEVSADTSVLLVAGERWFAVVRITGEADPRAFLSDSRAGTEPHADRLAALLNAYARQMGPSAPAPSGDSAGTPADAEGDAEGHEAAVGDPDLLDDHGVPAATLADLGDRRSGRVALAEIAERTGMRDAYAQLR